MNGVETIMQLSLKLPADQNRLRDISGVLMAAVAASLPWSTSATAILMVLWLLSLLPILRWNEIVRELRTPAGALPVALWIVAVLGMLWADVSWAERLNGLKPFHKLLVLPLLLAQFRQTPNVSRVLVAFLAASVVLMLVSWALVLLPGLHWRGKISPGVPVKDYISQSGVFTLCIFGLLWSAVDGWRQPGRRWIAWLLAAAFLGNIVYVVTARTSLVVVVVLALLFAFRRFGWKGLAALCVLGSLAGSVMWASSPYLRERVSSVGTETQQYRNDPGTETSAGLRLEFWNKSLTFIRQAPWIGHGTGTIVKLFGDAAAHETGIAGVASANPHNQTFMVAIQLGLLGAVVLYAMWLAHLLLFRGDDLVNWIGLCVVVQNIVGSAFNSHLSDFSQGWLYVIGVGVLGGIARHRAPAIVATSRSPVPAAAP